ncbi:MAG: hypothetical protein VKN72_11835 [Nostocales cyanobacterium 94392]|nr:hypothetical protein [Nostocales cyanobacterium 94392]
MTKRISELTDEEIKDTDIFPKVTEKTSTVTISIATEAVVTWSGHGLPVNTPFQFFTTDKLPDGITAGTKYYIAQNNYTANSFKFSATEGGTSGLIGTSGTQSGIHTVKALKTVKTTFSEISSKLKVVPAVIDFTPSVGDNTINHGLDSRNVSVELWRISASPAKKEIIGANSIEIVDENNVKINFTSVVPDTTIQAIITSAQAGYPPPVQPSFQSKRFCGVLRFNGDVQTTLPTWVDIYRNDFAVNTQVPDISISQNPKVLTLSFGSGVTDFIPSAKFKKATAYVHTTTQNQGSYAIGTLFPQFNFYPAQNQNVLMVTSDGSFPLNSDFLIEFEIFN